MKNKEKADLLRANGLEPRNRLLFTGPPGNGKTSLAEAIANELMLPFYVVKYDSLIGSYLGETSSRLKRIFEFIDSQQCVLFFDEFDTIAKERGAEFETGEIKRVVSSLLLNIDDLVSDVIVITASNHAELLDKAVWRRFQVKLALENPTRKQIEEWFLRFFQRFEYASKYSEKTLGKYLYGLSFSDIEQFCFDIQRRFVLKEGEESLRDVISYKLKQWNLPKNK
ncbi:MAG: ATP-binding protein [Balneolaceae bacterium]|nr:ATP-binding protein [Balneolaceae bacterium]